MTTTRRELLGLGLAAGSAASAFWTTDSLAASAATKYSGAFAQLDRFVAQYMRDMNTPAMTLVLADRDGVQRVASYGATDAELFQIGSITKSFTALVLMQLHEEGKLDFDRPIVDYLPWLRIQSTFASITAHHLLTHSSGLTAGADIFPSGATDRHLARYAPGQHFYYNNNGYAILGMLAWTLDGRELPQQFQERIFKPLGMQTAEPTIDFDNRARLAKSWSAFAADRPYPRRGRLSEAPAIITSNAAGCIAANGRDMGAYVHMLINGGKGLVSPESFKRFSSAQIAAEYFGPGLSYGYGLVIDSLDGHKLIRHTGGMVSFMSSMMVDVEAGIGGFASINAQQGYRPNPVVKYALQLMRAQAGATSLPPLPARDDPQVIANAADYAGSFTGSKGTLGFIAEKNRLFLVRAGKRIALERRSADQFLLADGNRDRFALVFGRRKSGDAAGPVVEVGWGDEWYTNAAYDGPREFAIPASWHSYVGHYHNGDPWIGSLRIVIRKGQLLMDGTTPLEVEGNGELFRFADEPENTDWIRFGEIVNGKCMRLSWSDVACLRVAVA